MSRYQPPPRDRSPPRFSERRPSVPYNGAPGSSSYRTSNEPSPLPVDRAPPRGPKAETVRGGYQYGSSARGRGALVGRAEPWDRDHDRDQRDGRPPVSSYRRDDDRPDWSRRDRDFNPPDRGIASGRDARTYVGRDRSASPTRPRGDSKESLYPGFVRPAEGSSYTPSRGATPRGRGRDWERGRGRSSFAGDRDRDLFAPRSKSREAWRDRDRDWDRESTRLDRPDRRDLDRSRERDSRPREYDSWQRERPPSRQEAESAGQNLVTPTTATSAAFSDASHGTSERTSLQAQADSARRPSIVLTPAGQPKEARRESDAAEIPSGRPEPQGRDARMYSPAPVGPTSTSASLDYGPPPAPPTSDKSATFKANTQKLDASTSAQTSFQPPTGPKAERNAVQNPLAPVPKATGSEAWPKPEARSRSLQPAPSLGVASYGSDTPKASESTAESRQALPTSSDKPLPPGVPLGPRSGNVVPNKPRIGTKEPVLASTPPIAPKGPSKPMNVEQRTAIPTGPRLWASESKPPPPSRPSIMGPLNKPYHDRSSFSSGTQRPELSFRQPPTQPPTRPRHFQPSIMNRPAETISIHDDKRATTTIGPGALKGALRRAEDSDADEEVDLSMKASSEDEAEDDDALDEDDFRDLEEKHEREIRALESKKPPPLLKDPVIVSLLLRIQMLTMIADDAIPPFVKDKLPSIEDVPMTEPNSTGLLSPKTASDEESKGVGKVLPLGRPLKEPPINPIPTPPIDDLPFLKKDGLLQRLTFEDSDDEVEREAMATLVQQDLERKAWEWRDEIDILRNTYRENYLLWRSTVQELDLKRELRTATPAPASPAPITATSLAPLVQERTRGARNATEADIEAVMRLSEQSAREEQEKRERETSEPNLETEAVLPSMLQPSELEMQKFKDTNKLIPLDLAIDVFSLIPPVDDFTEEEQAIFIAAYVQYPKKFGKIADKLPDRTYRQCIMHYYLTKDEANYKENFRRIAPKRGRRRLPFAQARANALLTESIYQDDAESTPMTDSGRPRRAAAPTFGDSGADSETTQLTNSSKRATAGTKDVNGELVVKATRGRRAGTGPKTKRTKAQVPEDQRLAQMQSINGVEGSPQKGRLGRPEKAAPLIRGNLIVRPDPGQPCEMPRNLDGEAGSIQPSSMEYPAPQPIVTTATTTGPQIGSYWSVPEQTKFPELIAYFGRDFAAIADFMKTKTVVMITNFYQRQLDGGKKELEQAALLAEDRRRRGEPPGPPPAPIAPIKRRYETTPSSAGTPRNIVSAVDNSAAVAEPLVPKMPSVINDFDPNTVQRDARGEIISKPRESHNPTALAQQRPEDSLIHDRAAMQQPRHMPPAGLFRNERDEPRASHMSMAPQEQHMHPHPQPRGIDLIRDEPPQARFSALPHQPAHPRDIQPQNQHTSGLVRHPENTNQSHIQSLLGHSRANSSISIPSTVPTGFDRTSEMSYSRNESHHHPLQFGAAANHSPVMPQQQNTALQSAETTRSNSTSAGPPAEHPKPAPAKRSNIMSILNPESQPAKRPSLDATRPLVASSPVPLARQAPLLNQTRAVAPGEDLPMLNRPRHSYDLQQQPHHTIAPSSSQPEFGSPPPAHITRDRWMRLFDPRQHSASSEHQPSASASASQGHYSVAPPPTTQASNLTPLQRLQQLEISGRVEAGRSGGVDLSHRTMLGQMNHPGLAPSPPPHQPPQQQIQPQAGLGPPYRSASGSSQHSRSGSMGYGLSQQHPQSQSHHQPQAQPHSHSHSASSTPVSSLHPQQHRSHGSIGYEPRLSLGSHPSQPLHPQPPPQSQLDLERERARHDREVQQQVLRQQQASVRQREREREREHEMTVEQLERERERLRAFEPGPGPAFGFRAGFALAAMGETGEQERRERERERDRQQQQQQQSFMQHLPQRDVAQEREREREASRYTAGPPIPMIPRRAETLGGVGRPMADLEREKDLIPRTRTPPSTHGPHGHGHGHGLGLGIGLFGQRGLQEREREREGPPIRSMSQGGGGGGGGGRGEEMR